MKTDNHFWVEWPLLSLCLSKKISSSVPLKKIRFLHKLNLLQCNDEPTVEQALDFVITAFPLSDNKNS